MSIRSQTLLGRGYHSSTLSQFLGQLERVGAAEALMPALVPARRRARSSMSMGT